MKVLITHPFYWPYVRRGAERYVHELAEYLSCHGYRPHVVTSKPGRSRTIARKDVTVHYCRQLNSPLLRMLGLTPEICFAADACRFFIRERYDLVHAFFPSDGYAAHLLRRFKDLRYVLNFNGAPLKVLFGRSTVLEYLMKRAFASASVIVVNSHFAGTCLKEDYGRDGTVIPGAVDMSAFFVTKDKDLDRPKILCTAAVDTPYKNVPLLVKAFELFTSKVPGATLQLSGHTDSRAARALMLSVNSRTRQSIQMLGIGKVQDLPRLYSEAALCVLPSLNESFGMVLVEALASGTPVVGTESGGIPEIISHPHIGVLFKPNRTDDAPTNAGDLCDAMLGALELAKDPETAQRCVAHARQFDWSEVGAAFVRVYERVSAGA